MGLETGTYVNDLNTANPVGGDPTGQGDEHLRLIKTVLKNTFPGFARPFRHDTASLGSSNVTVATTDDRGLFGVDVTSANRTVTLPSAPDVGFEITVVRLASTDGNTNTLTITRSGSDLINGRTDFFLTVRWASVKLRYCGSNTWLAVHGGNTSGGFAFDLTSDNQSTFFGTTYGVSATFFGGRRGRNTQASPTAVQSTDALFNIGGRGHDGTSMSGTVALLSCRAAENWTSTARGTYWEFYTTPIGGTGQIARARVDADGIFKPAADATYTMGSALFRFTDVFATSGSVNTSDDGEKNTDGVFNMGWELLDEITPITFKWKVAERIPVPSETEFTINDDGEKVPVINYIERPGKRTHVGFSAQGVKRALDKLGLDLAVWGRDKADDPNSRQWLRPDQIMAMGWSGLQRAKELIKELRADFRALRDDQSALKDELRQAKQAIKALEARVMALGG